MSNVKYGANYTGSGSAETGDLVPEAEIEAITDGRAFAESLMANEHALLKGDAFGTLNEANEWKLTDVPAGYYLIVVEGAPAAGDSYSVYIMHVVDDGTMKPSGELTVSDGFRGYAEALDIRGENASAWATMAQYPSPPRGRR